MTDLATRLSLDAGTLVDLFEILDADGTVQYRLTPGPKPGGADVTFGGQAYKPLPIAVRGIGYGAGARSSATPELVMSRLDPNATDDPRGDDWLGWSLRWKQTLAQHLDGAADADSTAVVAETWIIRTELRRSRAEIVFGLGSILGDGRVRLPKRQVLRSQCTWTYRTWDAANNRWIAGDCPYAGANRFDEEGNAVNSNAADKCSHELGTGCRPRYPAPQVVPLSAFLGVSGAGRHR